MVGIRAIPDERLRCEIQVPRPRNGAVAGADTTEQGIVRAQAIEYGTPEQVLNVTVDDGTVRQRKPETPTVEGRGGSNASHHGGMLLQRSDPPQRQSGLCQLPVRDELVGVQRCPLDHKGVGLR